MKTGTIGPAPKILGFVVVAIAAVWRAWDLRFVQDDAYISWRYADNLVRGLGLVWNEGERVEGYTNFLWTLIAAIPHALGLDVERFTTLLGLALFTSTLAMFYALVGALTRSWVAAAAATLTLGLFPSFAAYATGGLETQMQACFFVAMVTLVISGMEPERPSVRLAAAVGTTGALAILTRMDSVVVVGPLIAVNAWSIRRAYGSRWLAPFALAVGVPFAICGSWLAWKFVYYGSLLPNTYRAKVEGMGGLTREGMRFFRTFVQAYAFYLPLACVPIGGWLTWQGRLDRRLIVVISVPLALWIAYVVRIGGDFMEYRLVVPALPLVLLATYWVMCALDAQPARAALLTSIVLAGGMWSYRSGYLPMPAGSPLPLEDIALRDEWFEIGAVLRDAFAHSIQPTIAVVPAGVIPYLSRLPSVDMLGLNDPDVREFYRRDHVIGHRRLAPLDLLERRRVHFLIAHPVVRARLPPPGRYRFADFAQRPFAFPDEYRLKGRPVIELPLSGSRVMLMVYLTEDSAVTARIDQLGWRHYPLD